MSFTISNSTTTATLDNPSKIRSYNSKELRRIKFFSSTLLKVKDTTNGTVELEGLQITNAQTEITNLLTIWDAGEEVTVSGLPFGFDGNYLVVSVEYEYTLPDRCKYRIVLEKT